MSEPARDTIFALSSGRPPAAIGVVRISGPRAGDALKALTGRLPCPRAAELVRVRDAASRDVIDQALAVWFPAPHSETGEDVAELQLHGGRAVIAATLASLGRIQGLRPAEAGEFTRRAFENGKLDLTAVEGLADLVMAETEGQRRQALRQLQGALGKRGESWRQRLIEALALVEARIDFSEEAEVLESSLVPALAIAREVEAEIAAALADGGRGERLREGLVVAIAGPPNAGKSTLLNRIARREVAIVSPYAGTTRDVIEVHLDLDGWPVTLLDTAGIRETEDPVEMEGVRRAQVRAETADLVLWVVDARDTRQNSAKSAGEAGNGPPKWLILNKTDLLESNAKRSESKITNVAKNENGSILIEVLGNPVKNRLRETNESEVNQDDYEFRTSAVTGEGFDVLLGCLAARAEAFLGGGESTVITRQRHRYALEECLTALKRAQSGEVMKHEDLLAIELRIAANALGRLTGRVDVEDILDVIFRDFCIGK